MVRLEIQLSTSNDFGEAKDLPLGEPFGFSADTILLLSLDG
jgi:hypothetical protein